MQMSQAPTGALGFPSQESPEPAQHEEIRRDARPAAGGHRVGSMQRQIGALLHKNVLILSRNWVSTALRLLSCVFFMFLMWVIISAINSTRDNRSWVRNLPHPPGYPVGGIQACAKPGCIALAYAPAPAKSFTPSADAIAESEYHPDLAAAQREELQRVHAIIRSAMANNREGALPPAQVMGFTSELELDEHILLNANSVSAGVILASPAPGKATFTIQANSSRLGSRVETVIVPLQVLDANCAPWNRACAE